MPLFLILCTGNSCRSHMAEGILRAAAGEMVAVASAGSAPAGYVHPLAIEVLKEIDIDISGHTSKHLKDFLAQDVHTVITRWDSEINTKEPGQDAILVAMRGAGVIKKKK